MSDVLTRLFEETKLENIAQVDTAELADALLIALEDCEDISQSHIISAEALQMSLGYKRGYPPPSPVISNSEGDEILMALMAAWQWLKREVYLIPRPEHMFKNRMVGPGEMPLYITKRGYERIAELSKIERSN